MTRKDYELIARVLRAERPSKSDLGIYWMWEGIVVEMANALPETNPSFDRMRFLRACGLDKEPLR